jgi:proline iminopeptidase
VVGGLAQIFTRSLNNEADRERVLKAASACVAWEASASRLKRDESSQSQPNQKYALMAGRILIHYMINGGFLSGDTGRDNNHILDNLKRLGEIPVYVVHGRYDRVCHLSQAEALVRGLRAVGNKKVHYFITTAGHSSLEPETDSRLCAIMDGLPPMNPFDRGGE